MTQLINGTQIGNGNIFFDSGHMYISEAGSSPIVIKNIQSDLIKQIADFFYYHGNNPQICAFKIEFPELKIYILKTLIYFITDKASLKIEAVPSQIKKAGTWLRKQK